MSDCVEIITRGGRPIIVRVTAIAELFPVRGTHHSMHSATKSWHIDYTFVGTSGEEGNMYSFDDETSALAAYVALSDKMLGRDKGGV